MTASMEKLIQRARSADRPNALEFIHRVFEDFHPQAGDRLTGEDPAIVGGVALFHGRPVTVIGQRRGRSTEENIHCRFGMPTPAGYHKARRLMMQADKFRRPVLTLVDTPGAYPGLEAEALGQGAAIARCLALASRISVPSLALVLGEGGSGGALALSVTDEIWMMENAIYSVVSPEGCASILWKDPSRAGEAAAALKLTARDAVKLGICDHILTETFAFEGSMGAYRQYEDYLEDFLARQDKISPADRLKARYDKYRKVGSVYDHSIGS